jgi:hypothetical protein
MADTFLEEIYDDDGIMTALYSPAEATYRPLERILCTLTAE